MFSITKFQFSFSSVDEIVLSYMISILEELGSDGGGDDAFDVEDFTEMMAAYLPGFDDIDRLVCNFYILNFLLTYMSRVSYIHVL